jgi:hypothetical protein
MGKRRNFDILSALTEIFIRTAGSQEADTAF